MMECSFADGVLITRVLVRFVSKEEQLLDIYQTIKEALQENTSTHPMLIECWKCQEPTESTTIHSLSTLGERHRVAFPQD